MINSFRNENYYLSNFSFYPVQYDGIRYQNAEAAFQAQKCTSRPERERFSELNSSEAKKLGRKVKLRPDWEECKVQLMREIVFAKFEQNPEIRDKLLATGDEYLEEGNTWGDRIWGTVNGQGANLLGKILMEVREHFRELRYQREDEEENRNDEREARSENMCEKLSKTTSGKRYLYQTYCRTCRWRLSVCPYL